MYHWKEIYSNEELHDVEFRFRESEDRICAHKFVLGVLSPVFKSMLFTSGLEESGQAISIINISDCSPGSIKELLDYLYTGLIPSKFSISLWQLGDKYMIKNMHNRLLEHYTENIESDQELDLFLELAEEHGMRTWECKLKQRKLEMEIKEIGKKNKEAKVNKMKTYQDRREEIDIYPRFSNQKFFKLFSKEQKIESVILVGVNNSYLVRDQVYFRLYYAKVETRTWRKWERLDSVNLFAKTEGAGNIVLNGGGNIAKQWAIVISYGQGAKTSALWKLNLTQIVWNSLKFKSIHKFYYLPE